MTSLNGAELKYESRSIAKPDGPRIQGESLCQSAFLKLGAPASDSRQIGGARRGARFMSRVAIQAIGALLLPTPIVRSVLDEFIVMRAC